MVCYLTLGAATWLVDHNTAIRQRYTLAFGTATQQKRPHTSLQANANRLNIWFNILHGIVNREAVIHTTARAINIELNILLWVEVGKMQQLRHNKIGGVLVHIFAKENHALIQ